MQVRFGRDYITTEVTKNAVAATYLVSPVDNPQQTMVLTVLATRFADAHREQEAILRRGEAIEQLQHPALLPYLEVGVENEHLYTVRESLPFGSLRTRLDHLLPERLSLPDALSILVQIGQGLCYAHQQYIYHSGITPRHILFDKCGHALLADFNLLDCAHLAPPNDEENKQNLCYQAPEQFTGVSDDKSDQYALGCIAYEMLTGYVPFAPQNFSLLWSQQSAETPLPISQLAPETPADVEAAILRALEKEPAQRFSSIAAFIDALCAGSSENVSPDTASPDPATTTDPLACIEVSSEQSTSQLQLQQSSHPDTVEDDVQHDMKLDTIFDQIMQNQYSSISVQSSIYIPETVESEAKEQKNKEEETEQKIEEPIPTQTATGNREHSSTIAVQEHIQPVQKKPLSGKLAAVSKNRQAAPLVIRPSQSTKNRQAAPLVIRPSQSTKKAHSQFGKRTMLISIAILILFVLFLSYKGALNDLRGPSTAVSTATTTSVKQSLASSLSKSSVPVLQSMPTGTPQPTSTTRKKSVVPPLPTPTPTQATGGSAALAALPSSTTAVTGTLAAPTANRIYEIVKRNSSLLMDVAGSSTANGAHVIQNTFNSENSQRWMLLTASTSSFFFIMNLNSGLVLSVPGGSSAQDIPLNQESMNGSQHQQWQFVSAGDGDYTIVNLNSGQGITIPNNSSSAGTSLDQGSNDGEASQQWQLLLI